MWQSWRGANSKAPGFLIRRINEMATKKANETFSINVYDKEGKVVKTCTAIDADIRFGSVRKIMALLDLDDINDTFALLKTIYGAWDQTTKVLSECFPDMEDADWDNVLIKDLVPVVVGIAKASLAKILDMPSEKN
jgi:hypothetical protein